MRDPDAVAGTPGTRTREKNVKKLSITVLALLALAPSAFAAGVRVNDPTGHFSDDANSGYIQASDDGAQACNESKDATPQGDALTGYAYVSVAGQSGEPTQGNEHVGSQDADGETTETDANENDCPGAGDNTEIP